MKQYNGEKAIISLTSWKARIDNVDKTIFSLIQQCPGFHIVLVLSEEEFPQKEKELPENLMVFVENELIELLWVYKNYKSLKKIIPTMIKYNNVPIISADDDCLYVCNYAEELYKKWCLNKLNVITYKKQNNCAQGPCTLYPPGFLDDKSLENFYKEYKYYLKSDDAFYFKICKAKKITILYVHLNKFPYLFHTNVGSLHDYKSHLILKNLYLQFSD